MKSQTNSSTPAAQKDLELLENTGHGDGLYAQALRHGLEEEKTNPGRGRAIVMQTMNRTERPSDEDLKERIAPLRRRERP
jgi:hypothetical protein